MPLVVGCAAPPSSLPVPASRSASSARGDTSPTAVAARSRAAPDCEPLLVHLPPLIETKLDVPIPPIEDPSGQALAAFYARLEALLRRQADEPVRMAVYGDSNLTEDLLTSEMRRVLQQRYGDAGHGYVAIGKPWAWYTHRDVQHGLERKAWKSYAVSTDPAPDQCYGFAGIAAQSRANGARAWVATAEAGAPVGRTASRADIFFLRQPRGGRVEVQVDTETLASIDTAAPELSAGFRRIEFEDGPHRIRFVAKWRVRLFGVALERDGPGIVIDSLGVGGANEKLLARMRESVAREALTHRPYDLVVFLTGATEDVGRAHEQALRRRIQLHQQVLPHASLLVMSPPDFANGNLRRPRPSQRIVRLGRDKRRIAQETGCAFWDFHGAMGGKLSIARFAMHNMAQYDLAHLNARGAAYMARRFLVALLQDFARRRQAELGEACVRLTAQPPGESTSG
jgi:hypothetical protein